MNKFAKRSMQGVSVLATALFLAVSFAHASTMSDEQSLARGGVEDVTPQQKYQTAIREAGGAYKEALRECTRAAGDDRQACTREAKAAYERGMADAKLILNRRAPTQARAPE